MMICERCDSNKAVFAALCDECMWFVLTGETTFTVADMDAQYAEDFWTDIEIDELILARHGW